MTSGFDLSPIDHAARVRAICADADGTTLHTDLTDVRWLTGFHGSNGWAITRRDELIVGTDGRYGDKAREETAGTGATIVVEQRADRLHRRLVELLGDTEVALDASAVTHSTWTRLAADIDLVNRPSPITRARRMKDAAEVERIAAAAACADGALAEVEPNLCGMTELEVRAELEYLMVRQGADDRSYETIVASGPDHGARPHHGASRRTIAEGDTVIIDVGALVDGYHSDMTRSWVIGDPTPEQREIYALVAAAQEAGLEATRPGVQATEIDAACRAVFDEAGYLDWYIHGTGHGVGLDIHESPFHSPISTDVILADDVVTIEPGLYRGGFGGFRIEDLVHVTESGYRVLTHSPKRELN
ncbi:M24 family metallopeptidase [Ilumatobacter nonamiensis]|uniref:M24 family metallopeptidase n=1 Tax=Ilumatobacter nonamiensis TaxID=467093 RepID=UPI00034B0D34|nr:M24 family metallopeptidase [Ilumatobacter nonamiensis]